MATTIYTPNEVVTGSFSVQNISGSVFLIFNGTATGLSPAVAKMKQFGGSMGYAQLQVVTPFDYASIGALTAALSGAAAAGTASFYAYGV